METSPLFPEIRLTILMESDNLSSLKTQKTLYHIHQKYISIFMYVTHEHFTDILDILILHGYYISSYIQNWKLIRCDQNVVSLSVYTYGYFYMYKLNNFPITSFNQVSVQVVYLTMLSILHIIIIENHELFTLK